MLTYAFKILRQQSFDSLLSENFADVYDMFAEIILKALSRQIKHGLYKEHIITKQSNSILNNSINDNFTENNIYNQIIKTTVTALLQQDNVLQIRKNGLKKILINFKDISTIQPSAINWRRLHFCRRDLNYDLMLNISYFVLDSLQLEYTDGSFQVTSFFDEKNMEKLFEKFVREYFRTNFRFNANSKSIRWNLGDNNESRFSPKMQSDIILKKDDKTLIIDTRFYSTVLKKYYYDLSSIRSADMYQIFTYIKNFEDLKPGKLSGMLLYAKVDDSVYPDDKFEFCGNYFYVRTIDLNKDFVYIKQQLNSIANLLINGKRETDF